MATRIAAVQMMHCDERPEERLQRIDRLLRAAAERNASLAVFPELSLASVGFDGRNYALAEEIPGPKTDALAELARRHDLHVVAGLSEKCGRDYFNTMVLVGPDGYLGRYRKVHNIMAERAYWKNGGYQEPIHCDLGRIGIGICADMYYSTPWKWYRDKVDLLAIGAAFGSLDHVKSVFVDQKLRDLHRSSVRALPDKISRGLAVPVAMANSCGVVHTSLPPLKTPQILEFLANSCIVQSGHRVDDQGQPDERLLLADVEPTPGPPDAAVWRGPWVPEASWRCRWQFRAGAAIAGMLYANLYALRAIWRRQYLRKHEGRSASGDASYV
jgi:predicted amidohydrolase